MTPTPDPAPDEETGAPVGALEVTITGATAGANVSITGPADFSRTLTATTTLEDLEPGAYTLTATATGAMFVEGGRTREVEVEADATAEASFAYARAFGFGASLDVNAVSFKGTATLDAALSEIHPDLTAVEVSLTAPDG